MYDDGNGVRQDHVEAATWYRRAAERGLAEAQHNLAVAYDEGQGVPQDHSEAVRWYFRAAEQGLADAQHSLALKYEYGQGVPQDYTEAVNWYRRAAEQGFEAAQNNLGVMYMQGRGVSQDYAEAINWYSRAAEQGDASAQNNLGIMYSNGLGVPQDQVLAYMWLNLAAAHHPPGENREQTAEARDKVAAYLSPQEIARAQRMAREWRPFEKLRIRVIQWQLTGLGYDPGPADGIIGPKTRAAIRAFQSDVGLPVDGEISDALTAALSDAASSDQNITARSAPAQDHLLSHDDFLGTAPAPAEPRLHSTGTGFVVSESGQILTNHHVVDACTEVRVGPAGQDGKTVAVVARDGENDLALLETPLRLPAATFRDGRGIRAGEDVVAVGFPLHGLLASEANVTTGTVSALAGMGNDTRFLQVSVPLQPGNSGGPLLDAAGHVVGIAVGKLDAVRIADATGDIPQNVNFAIKASLARSFLDANGVDYESAPSAQELGAAEVGERAKAFTVLVECWK
jgi:TPR repeat protein/S1-C subfamily serine protease